MLVWEFNFAISFATAAERLAQKRKPASTSEAGFKPGNDALWLYPPEFVVLRIALRAVRFVMATLLGLAFIIGIEVTQTREHRQWVAPVCTVQKIDVTHR